MRIVRVVRGEWNDVLLGRLYFHPGLWVVRAFFTCLADKNKAMNSLSMALMLLVPSEG